MVYKLYNGKLLALESLTISEVPIMFKLLLGTILRILAFALIVQVIWFCPSDCERRMTVCNVLGIYHKHIIQGPTIDARRIFRQWKKHAVRHLYRAAVYYAEYLEPDDVEYSSEVLLQ
jgi:hypothetical protein